MKFARTTPPATAAQLEAEAGQRRTKLAAMRSERDGLAARITDLVGDACHGPAEARLAELEALIPVEGKVLARIEAAIPTAEHRERRQRIEAEIEEQARKSAKLSRGLAARYTKAAEAYAEVCRDIQADSDRWRQLNALADTVSPRAPVPHHTAEWAAHVEGGAVGRPQGGSVTEGLDVWSWDKLTLLFRS